MFSLGQILSEAPKPEGVVYNWVDFHAGLLPNCDDWFPFTLQARIGE